jgi:hypothetical protein
MRTSHPLAQSQIDSTILDSGDDNLSNTPTDDLDSDSGNSND